MKKKIVVTGGTGRFGSALKNIKTKFKIFYPKSKELDITNIKSIKSYLKNKKPKILLHFAGMSRPMIDHEKNISKSINLNIVGTANLVSVCSKMNIKIVYISTSYVYTEKKGGHKEHDPLLPWNNYGWSKLGGECATQMYKNSLIIRACVSEKPFLHKRAFKNVIGNFLYHDEAAKMIFKLLNKKGVINLGGKSQSIFNFAKKTKPDVKKINASGNILPRNLTINLAKLKKNL